MMAVDAGAAMAGYVLDDRQDGAVEQPRTHGAGEARDPFRIASIGPVADHRIRPRHREIQHRQAINGDPEPRQVVGDQPSAEAGRRRRRRVRQRGQTRGRWVAAPVRRAQPRHPAAFLVDQDRRVVAADAAAQRGDQIAHLIGRAAVAAEQDEADRVGGGEEIAFRGGKALAGAAQDNRERRVIGQ